MKNIIVEHHERRAGSSTYTLARIIKASLKAHPFPDMVDGDKCYQIGRRSSLIRLSSPSIKLVGFKAEYNVKSWDALFPPEEYYQVMYVKLLSKRIVHAENLGGDLHKLSNKRVWIGCFPLKGIELESSMCRIVALLPPDGT